MSETHIDSLVVGAGFSGIYQLYSLLQHGMNCKLIDTAPDVGGTWYWNQYPGAMSDTYSFLYRYSWDKEDLQSYPWPKNYVVRDDILGYLKHVVEKYKLRDNMQFETEMVSAEWDEELSKWRVRCTTGDVFVVQYLITGLGLVSKKNYPDIPGIADGIFRGPLVHSAEWDPRVDIRDKRVGLIGCGSTGIQITVAIAGEVQELRCFIRHPQYTVPTGLRVVPPEERKRINDTYDHIWSQARESNTAFGFEESARPTMSVSAEEREKIFEDLWQQGNGFRFMFGGFGDMMTNPEANEEACKFLRRKITQIVRDPAKAAVLTPHDYHARRPPCDNGYYESFNQDNVFAVDVKKTPITRIEERGIVTADGKLHELDIIIFATGFEAVDGSYRGIRDGIKGRGGVSLNEHWASGPKAYLGIFVAGFPNLFLLNGPQGPFCNQPPAIEKNVEFITCLLRERKGIANDAVIETTAEAEALWNETCNTLASHTIFDKVESWITGTNIPGAKPSTRFYYGGLKDYLARLKDIRNEDYRGLTIL